MKHSIKVIALVVAFSCGIAHASDPSRAANLGAHALQAQHEADQAQARSDAARNSFNSASAADRTAAAQAAQAAQDAAQRAANRASMISHNAAVAAAQEAQANAPVASQDPAKSAAMSIANTMGGMTVTASTLASVADNMAIAHEDPTGKPGNFTATAVTNQPANSTINQAAANVPASTPVNVTDTKTGKTVTTTAGAIAAVNPAAQITTPINSVFAAAPRKGGNNHNDRNSRSEHGTGNGGNNAANSNSAHGLGGGNHIGGGSAQSGSRNVGHW